MRLLLLATLSLAATADAQVRQGLFEVGGAASLYSRDAGDDRVTVFTLAPEVGYLFTDQLEAGFALVYTKVEGFDGSGDLALFAEYHFGAPGARTVPFLGLRVGTSITDDGDVLFGGNGGAKVFFLPGGAVTGELVVLTDGDDVDLGVQAGVAIFF